MHGFEIPANQLPPAEFGISVFCISQRSHLLAVAPPALLKLGYSLECCDSVCPADQKAV